MGSENGMVLPGFFEELDKRGVVIVMSVGNDGYNQETGEPDHYQGEILPQVLGTDKSPYIVVGATYHDGSIAEFTTPPGNRPDASEQGEIPSISIWAQGLDVYTCNLASAQSLMGFRDGTSVATPQVVSYYPPTQSQTLVIGISLLIVLFYPGWSCCVYAFVPLARGPKSFQPR